jgi:hypothetical protein
MLKLVCNLDNDGFQIRPDKPTPTYADSGSTLDYIIVSGDALIRGWSVESNLLCQHLPVTANLLIPVPLAPLALPLRKRNLRFDDGNVKRTRELLDVTVAGWNGPSTVESLYSAIESCFLSGGTSGEQQDATKGPASWWRYVPQAA